MINRLDTSVMYLKGVGPHAAEVLKNIGVEKVSDLLTLIPVRYARRSTVKAVTSDEEIIIEGRIIDTRVKRTSRGPVFVVHLTDGTGTMAISFFNYPQKARAKFEPNKLIEVEGQVSIWGNQVQLINPGVSFVDSPTTDSSKTEKLLPMYPLSQWLTHRYIRKIVKRALEVKITETLPNYIVEAEGLLTRVDAIYNLHFPDTLELAAMARKRLEFEDLFWLQILVAIRKKQIQTKGIKFNQSNELGQTFLTSIRSNKPEFKLTNAQDKALCGIFADMESGNRMNRLLQGDVGSGKTIVAILSMLKAVESGYQAVLMAPTEVLAEQHYINLAQYLTKIGINVGLLTGNLTAAAKRVARQKIEDGKANIIVGTHALIEEDIKFNKLGLVVIDEQHKFGVMQRLRLVKKSGSPDVLVMTATPIPRSLSLTIYGDLDISVIDEMPPGVGETETRWLYEDKIQGVWEFVISEIKKNKQCYVVYPVIEESEKIDLKAAVEEYENLSTVVFKDYRVGLLHGRMKNKEKTKVMEDFREHKLDVLVATTVIEVGIDIPNASCMVIEHAERFGMAQLHQLRGRLRRGKGKSTCILVSTRAVTDLAKERLDTIVKENDGFKLAEKDLQLRGRGEVLGTKQHGIGLLVVDIEFLKHIKDIAFKIIDDDPDLQHQENLILKATLRHLYKEGIKLLEAG